MEDFSAQIQRLAPYNNHRALHVQRLFFVAPFASFMTVSNVIRFMMGCRQTKHPNSCTFMKQSCLQTCKFVPTMSSVSANFSRGGAHQLAYWLSILCILTLWKILYPVLLCAGRLLFTFLTCDRHFSRLKDLTQCFCVPAVCCLRSQPATDTSADLSLKGSGVALFGSDQPGASTPAGARLKGLVHNVICAFK